jgi:hypothetical protein
MSTSMDRMTGCRLGNADTQHVIARRRHIGWSEAGTRAPLAPKDDQLNPAAAVAPECRSFNQPSAQWSRGMVACLHPSSSRRDGEISLQTAHRIEEGVWRGLAPEGTCYRRQLTAAENSGLAWSSDPSGVRDGGRRGRSEAPQGVGPFVSAAQTRLPWASPAVRLHVRSACCPVRIGREEEHRLQRRQTGRTGEGRRRPTGGTEGAFGSPVGRAHTCSPSVRSVPLPSAHALPFLQLHVPGSHEAGEDGASFHGTALGLTACVRPVCPRVLCAGRCVCVLNRCAVPGGRAAWGVGKDSKGGQKNNGSCCPPECTRTKEGR